MIYVSTRGEAPDLDFEQVLLTGLARDGGLYVPKMWPTFSHQEMVELAEMSYFQLAVRVMMPFVEGSLSEADLTSIVHDSYTQFNHPDIVPLREIKPNKFILELYHGPTLAFKDCAMQLLCRLFEHILSRTGSRVTIVCATSGDTGSAAIEAARGRKALDLFVLFPKGRVSEVQQRQMTTVNAQNVHCIAVEGNFDDCQALVKNMFADLNFRDRLNLSAVNSINWGRVMAQVVYFFYAALKLGAPKRTVNFSVPTGNFGDILAGHVAAHMGLPIGRLCAATNRNDILARFFSTGVYNVEGVIPTLSPSMDIQVASNFERLLFDLYKQNSAKVTSLMEKLKETGTFEVEPEILQNAQTIFSAASVTEEETLKEIRQQWLDDKNLIDPHTAVGIVAGRACLDSIDAPTVYLATAHASKFPEAVLRATGVRPSLPFHLSGLMDHEERYHILPPSLKDIKSYVSSIVD